MASIVMSRGGTRQVARFVVKVRRPRPSPLAVAEPSTVRPILIAWEQTHSSDTDCKLSTRVNSLINKNRMKCTTV